MHRNAFILLPLLAVAGCASMAVSDDQILQNTAFALGIDADQLVIADRRDSGVKTTYSASTPSGTRYNCYVTGTIGVMGPAVSDAICSRPGEAAPNPLLQGRY
ncbi:hypothetical protein [Stutzerimonas tarimensis]|uniref:Lipoprotein n=1 Tax=Stutzerimonas tarimensis TaxID=1507735 RepID=A0ABV7T5E8_9GAMM